MRKLLKSSFLLFVLGSTFALNGCYSLYATHNYVARYSMGLSEVSRPQITQQRYGKQTILSMTEDGKNKYVFEDDLVKIVWLPTSSKFFFVLTNKTENSIKVIWDEAAFVDDKGQSQRVMHEGIKYSEREKSMPPSVVAKRGALTEVVFPGSNARYNSRIMEWIEDPLLQPLEGFIGAKDSQTFNERQSTFIEKIRSNKGKKFTILLPLQIQDVINEYNFTFTVDGIQVLRDGEKNNKFEIIAE